jgi:ABC-2 type transport system permease protein
MLKGFWKLTWIEMKVFVREPMGVIGSLLVPVFLYVVLGRALATGTPTARPALSASMPPFNVAILSALFVALGAVTSLVAIISIYREGGILKRLRATPLSPVTILGSHVVVKLIFSVLGLGLLALAGRQMFPGTRPDNLLTFTAAVLVGTLSILSLGFVIASIVPTARFAQPVSAAVLYPMLAVSGLFYPVDRMSASLRIISRVLPTSHATALMQAAWDGHGWAGHLGDVAALAIFSAVCVAVSTRVFRWE